MKPLHVSLALWATATVAHAQLQPMVMAPASQPVSLAPMGTLASSSGPLQPMQSATPLVTPTLLAPFTIIASAAGPLQAMKPALAEPKPTFQPMQTGWPGRDVSLTPLNRPGPTEMSRQRTASKLADPVRPLLPLAPPLHITPTTLKPVVLKKPESKPVIAASSNPLATIADITGITKVANIFHKPGKAPTIPTVVPSIPLLTDSELSPNDNIPTITRPEEQLLAVDVIINTIRRNTLLDVYQDDNQTLWLPLTPLAQLLEIPIRINAAAGVAQGWYQSPSNTLLINMATSTTTVGTQSFPISGMVEKHTMDLYITAPALKQWLGIDTTLDYNQLQLFITTPHPLPGDDRARRLNTWAETEKSRRPTAMPSDTIIPPHSNFSLPVMRLGANTNVAHSSEESTAINSGLTLQAENDIFGTTSNFALSFSQSSDGDTGLTGGSLLLQKRTDDPTLLGPLKARYVGFGDITTNPLPLSALTTRGRGLRISNTPEGAVNNPDQYILTGPAPINWDVEVYQDQALTAFQRIDNSGTYRFTALPLKAGRNVFRIVFYGPNGERDERRETIYLGDNIPDVGEVHYDSAVFQPNKALIPGMPGNTSRTATTMQAQFTTGLVQNWAATVGAFQTVGDAPFTNNVNPPTQGVGTGLRGSVGATYLTTDAFASTAGTSLQSTLRTPLTRNADLRIGQSRNMGYDPDDRDELSTTNAEVTLPFTLGNAAFNTAYGYTRTLFQAQPTRQSYTQRTSVGIGGLNATNNLTYSQQADNDNLNGTLETAVHAFGRSVNAGLTYQPDSPSPLRQFDLSTQLPIGMGKTANFTYTQQLTAPKTATLGSSVYWNTGPWAIGVQGMASSNGNVNMGVNLATALVPQGTVSDLSAARWKLSPPNGTLGQGQALVRVYADENNNGIYDADEPVIPGVTIANRLRGSNITTNARGIAAFTDLTPNTLVRLEIDPNSLPDIYLKPVSDTLNVKPHAGDNGTLNYALRLYGEISGQVKTSAGQPVQNLPVALFNAQGIQQDATTTEYDGYYTFGALPMGSYTLLTGSTSTTTVTLSSKVRIKTQNLTTY